MIRSIQTQFKIIGGTLMVLLMLTASQSLKAQDEGTKESKSVSISTTEDGKVKLQVIQRRGEHETNFEKTYESYEDMQNDPDLEKYGINKDDLTFRFNGGKPQFFFHNGPGKGFWDDEDFDMSRFGDMQKRIEEMMKNFGGNFAFDFDNGHMMDIDSLVNRFQFRNDSGRFFFNGDEIMDIDSLRDALKDRMGQFSFDFGDWEDDGNFGVWSFDHDDDDDTGVRVITRARVVIHSAKEEDKKAAGTDDMESLELRDISFYPNPSDGRFDVELATNSEAPVQIVIIDDEGNEVYNRLGQPSNGAYHFKVDLTHEGKGIYIMKLVQNDKALTKRVVIE
ncbi:T9SS type A sorting domain-containing protein [Roseivirga sp.]|uniref:T9SS type A sorting domain-containing protein n=1 Tax=Roseivirga sp. TaxID=1964215 RepID=UPI003B51B2E6